MGLDDVIIINWGQADQIKDGYLGNLEKWGITNVTENEKD